MGLSGARTHDQVMAATAEHQELERWRAAQTVRAHVPTRQAQDDVLECLGLVDLTRPTSA